MADLRLGVRSRRRSGAAPPGRSSPFDPAPTLSRPAVENQNSYPFVSSSVNNVNACGAGAVSGQWLPGLDVKEALTAGAIPQVAVSSDSVTGYRTNLVVMNPGTASATATVSVRKGDGTLLSSATIGPLAPNGFRQVALDDPAVFPGVAGRRDSNLWIELTSDRPVLAFASVIDNASGDPFAVVAVPDPR